MLQLKITVMGVLKTDKSSLNQSFAEFIYASTVHSLIIINTRYTKIPTLDTHILS